jgi:hypothetical protein
MTHPFPVPVTVTTPVGTSAPGPQYTYDPPNITAITPAVGPLAGGTRVTITGTDFTGATAVHFGANQAQPITVNSDTSITATSPAATGRGPVNVTVTVTNPQGNATSNAVQFTYPLGVLFHQNMRVFGGGQGNRNAAYLTAFGAISLHLNVNFRSVLVAGFTELTNNTTAVQALNVGLAGALGLGQVQAVNTRRTAVGGTSDYTGIAVAAGVNILAWGRIVPVASGQGVALTPDVWDPQTTAFANWASTLPPTATLDYQSLAYVVADVGATIGVNIPVAVAFLHNIFAINDNKALVLQNLGAAASLIAQTPAMGGNGAVFTCGDFNTPPVRRGTDRTGIAYPFSQASIAPPAATPPWSPDAILTPAQVVLHYQAGGTTAAGNLYDYSFRSVVGNPPPLMEPPQPAIDVVTLDTSPNLGGTSLMSDHAASLLNI